MLKAHAASPFQILRLALLALWLLGTGLLIWVMLIVPNQRQVAPYRDVVLELKTGNLYLYREVPAHIHQAFMAALSKGSFYNQWIRDDYPFVRVR